MLSNAQEILVVRFAFAGGLKFGQDNVCYVVIQQICSISSMLSGAEKKVGPVLQPISH